MSATRRGNSVAHHLSPVRFDDLQFRKEPYDKWVAYGQSKTGNVLLAVKAAKELGPRGVTSLAVHPGMIQTELSRSLTDEDKQRFSGDDEQSRAVAAMFKDVPRGAATSVWAATEPALKGKGPLYLEDSRVADVIEGPNRFSGVMAYALDADSAERLWVEVEKIVGRDLPL